MIAAGRAVEIGKLLPTVGDSLFELGRMSPRNSSRGSHEEENEDPGDRHVEKPLRELELLRRDRRGSAVMPWTSTLESTIQSVPTTR